MEMAGWKDSFGREEGCMKECTDDERRKRRGGGEEGRKIFALEERRKRCRCRVVGGGTSTSRGIGQ